MAKRDFKIGVVGVGRMGANIARHLKDVGFPVTVVYDSHKPLSRKLAKELGAKVAATLADVTAAADYIITVVTDDKSMSAIFATRGDSLLQGAKGKTFINCATISPATHVEVEKRAAKVRASTLEGCMASSITQARDGTLYLMCGGKRRPRRGPGSGQGVAAGSEHADGGVLSDRCQLKGAGDRR